MRGIGWFLRRWRSETLPAPTFARFALLLAAFLATPVLLPHPAAGQESGTRSRGAVRLDLGGDLYASGGSVTLPEEVAGDLVAAGGSVTSSGRIAQDAIVAGGSVNLLGDVGDDVRAAGGQVVIGGSVGDNVTAFGGSFHLLREARVRGSCLLRAGRVIVDGDVGGDLRASGGRVQLDGTVDGTTHVVAERLSIGEGAVLKGEVVYRSPHPAQVASGARIEGTLRREAGGREGRWGRARMLGGLLVGIALFRLIAMLAAALLLVLAFPHFARRVGGDAVGRLGLRALLGAAVLVVAPVAALLFLLTVVGIPVAAFLGFSFFAFLILAWILAGVVFGALLWRFLFPRKQPRVSVLSALTGVIVLHVILWIPILGGLVACFVVLASLGSLAFLAFDAIRCAIQRARGAPVQVAASGILVIAMLAANLLPAGSARAVERSEIPTRYTWDLSALYPNEAAWTRARASIEKRIPGLARFHGHLGASPDSLLPGLDYWMDLDRDMARLYTYASQLSDQDARVSRHLEMRQSVEQLNVQFEAAASWVRPEILKVGAETIHAFLAREPRLGIYRPFLEDVLRRAPHTLSPEEEKIVAQAGRFANAGGTIRDVFTNAELPYPEVRLSTGERVRLDAQGYTRYRALPNRADRDTVFRVFWSRQRDFQGTLGASLNAQTQAHVFDKDVHRFKSCLEAALFGDNIPTRVYSQLLSDVHANLPTLHRYLRLRRRMMKVDTLRYEDLYAPIVKEVDLKFTPEEAMSLTLAAVAPLGRAYVDTLKHGFETRWIDWLPNTGKASGAYSTGAYGVHPYQLQNFTGLYEEVSTLAHESGHSMHTYLADSHQPYVTHDYATFVAEVASTLNENLLLHHMLDRTHDRATRLFLLGSYLDNLRGTLFRQTLFAEFELEIHQMAERGEPLTGENLSKLYLKLVRTYYGHDRGVCRVNPLYAVEWAYIDHFFYNFYVYQYATSIVAATTIANRIRDEAAAQPPRTTARDAYLRMLSAGSSQFPIDLLKGAGVDMTTSVPFRAAMREMNRVMDEMEGLLK